MKFEKKKIKMIIEPMHRKHQSSKQFSLQFNIARFMFIELQCENYLHIFVINRLNAVK